MNFIQFSPNHHYLVLGISGKTKIFDLLNNFIFDFNGEVVECDFTLPQIIVWTDDQGFIRATNLMYKFSTTIFIANSKKFNFHKVIVSKEYNFSLFKGISKKVEFNWGILPQKRLIKLIKGDSFEIHDSTEFLQSCIMNDEYNRK